MNDSAPVVRVQGISRRFGELVAVDNVSFQVGQARIFGLLGPNGSGKSTLIRMLLGVLKPSGGTAEVLGFDVRQHAEAIKRQIGYMSQEFTLYNDLTVRENLQFYGRVYDLRGSRLTQRMQEVTELTSLGDRRHQLAGQLSGGWKRRLALACALIHQPRMLFLDEPTAGIDPVARRDLWDLLFRLSGQGITMLVTTHYMDEAERCSDVGYIYMSHLLAVGQPADLKQMPQVTPAGTERLELHAENPMEALRVLSTIEGVRDATLFGEHLHLLVDESLDPQTLVQQLGLSAAAADVRKVTPSLEDVFVALTNQAERDRERTRVATPTPTTEPTAAEPAAAEPTATEPTGPEPTAAGPGDLGPQPAVQPRPSHPGTPPQAIPKNQAFFGLWAILSKEFIHIRRQPVTIFFTLVVPAMQTIIFGYAIETQIEHIPMVVHNMDKRAASRELIEAFRNTRRFEIVELVDDERSFDRALTSGRAHAGLRIPPNYSDRIVRGEQVQVQLLIDGSDSQLATTALSTGQLLGLNLSIEMARRKAEASGFRPAIDATGKESAPLDLRPRLLFNPDLESAHFFVPGLLGIILQLVTLFLTSFAVVREREQGTLEQLFATPVGRAGLLVGKLVPYAIVGFATLLTVLAVMIYVFGVPVRGSIGLLLALSMLFMICSLALGLLVSTLARTQLEAVQFAFIIMLPSILLSGFVFPRSQMPLPIYAITFAIPATYFIEILRGIVLRAAAFQDLIPSVVGLIACGLTVLTLSVMRFQKKLG